MEDHKVFQVITIYYIINLKKKTKASLSNWLLIISEREQIKVCTLLPLAILSMTLQWNDFSLHLQGGVNTLKTLSISISIFSII